MHLGQQVQLARLYHTKPREQVRLLLSEVFIRHLTEFESHLQLEELVFDQTLIVEFLIGDLLNLVQDELQAADWREQQVVYEEHRCLPEDRLGYALAAFELEPYVHEVIRRPGSAVFEGKLSFILGGDLFDLEVELGLPIAFDEKCRVHNHLVAYGLIGARGDSRILQDGVDLSNVRVGLLRESRLYQPAQLHSRKIGRTGSPHGDLILQLANLFVLLFDFGYDEVAVPVDLQSELYFALHLGEHVAQGIVGSANQLDDILFGAKKSSEGPWQDSEIAHNRFVDLFMRENIVASRIVNNERGIGDDGRQTLIMDGIDFV